MIKRKTTSKKPAPKRTRALTNINNNLFAFHKARMLPHGRNVNVSCGMWKEEGGMRTHKGNLSPLSSLLNHDHLAIHDVQAMLRVLHTAAAQVIESTVLRTINYELCITN